MQTITIEIKCKEENTEKVMEFLDKIEFPMICDKITTKIDDDARF